MWVSSEYALNAQAPRAAVRYAGLPGYPGLIARAAPQSLSWFFERRAYELRDEECLRLKILTCMLPAI